MAIRGGNTHIERDGVRVDQVGQDGNTAALGSTGSRRAALSGVAGGLALAASGLLLPTGRIDTAAAKQLHTAGCSIFGCTRQARWGYYNAAGFYDVWFGRREKGNDGWSWKGSFGQVPLDDFKVYRTRDNSAAFLLVALNLRHHLHNTVDDQMYFGCTENPLTIGTGGRLDNHNSWEDGVTVVNREPLAPYQYRELKFNGLYCSATRIADDGHYYQWSLHFEPL